MIEVTISKGPESVIADEKDVYVRKIEQLKKQLSIAIKALKDYADKQMWIDEDLDYSCAEESLKQIEELDK